MISGKTNRYFVFLLGGAVLGAVPATPASASTLLGFTLATGRSNTVTFSSGMLQSISGWAPGSVTYNGMTYTLTGGQTTFTKGVMDTLTISGAVVGLAGLSSVSNLLTIAWTPLTTDDRSGATSPNLTYLYSGATYTFNPTLLGDLSADNPVAIVSPGVLTEACAPTCSTSDAGTALSTGTYQVPNEILTFAATATPEPASLLLIGVGLIAVSILRRK